MMPKGMVMLLKSMGLDAEKIMGEFQTAAGAAKQTYDHFNARLDVLEAQLSRIEKHLGTSEGAALSVVQPERKTGT